MTLFLLQKYFYFLEFSSIVLQTNNVDEEFNLFLFAILILGIIFICVSVLIALLLVAICLLIVFGLIALGALSASVLAGINKKSFTTGFKTFAIVFSTFAMAVLGSISFWALNRIVHWWSQSAAITIGLCAGVISGFITGATIGYLIKRLSSFLKNKLERRNGNL